jgi:hypothetical protein
LPAERGIFRDREQHAADVDSWIKALKDDKSEIFRAAHDASKATDFLFVLERDTSIADQSLGNTPAREAKNSISQAQAPRHQTGKLDRDRNAIGEEPIRTGPDNIGRGRISDPNAGAVASPFLRTAIPSRKPSR